MGTGIVVALLMIGFSTATFLVGMGFGYSVGRAAERKEQKEQLERTTDAVMGYIRGRAVAIPVEDTRTVGDHGEAVN